MCWPWNHKFFEVDRQSMQLMRRDYLNGKWSNDRHLKDITVITEKCSCGKYRQIKLDGTVPKEKTGG